MIAKFRSALLPAGIVLILFASMASQSTNLVFWKFVAALHDPGTQWFVFLFLNIYLYMFLFFQVRRQWSNSLCVANPLLWLSAALLAGAQAYFVDYEIASKSTDALTWVFGAALGQAVAMGQCQGKNHAFLIVVILAFFLVAASVWQPEIIQIFKYRGYARWSGPWSNPNLFGMLMGTGFVLVAGVATSVITFQRWHGGRGGEIWFFLCAIAALLMGRGLLHSYSRGAWLGTICGVGYLMAKWFQGSFQKSEAKWPFDLWPISRFHRKGLPLSVILISLLTLAFWQFRQTEWHPARRVFSVANINDFSWRNRVTAWEGAIRMMVHRPLFGYGWERAEEVYEKQYRPSNLENGAPIQMNDYFMLGISAGLPALLCFLIYVALSLRTPHSALCTPHSSPSTFDPRPSILQATCRAGAIVLLVGFWFDGGLFKLATGSVFWILLELGRTDVGRTRHLAPSSEVSSSPPRSRGGGQGEVVPRAQGEGSSDPETVVPSPVTCHPSPLQWLTRTAWLLAFLAFIETIILVATPFLPVNKATLTIARHWLISPKAVPDLNFLTTLDLRASTVGIVVQHASLANYNRELINWKLDDEIYRDYVLSPIIAPPSSTLLSSVALAEEYRLSTLSTLSPWRRPLWEYFYPPIRHETDPQSAARIVLKFLHERVTINSGIPTGSGPAGPPSTLDAMWHQQKADPKGFESLTVAAFRSVGIPARLNASGQAEILADGQWNPP